MDVLLTDADIVTMAAGAGPARSMLIGDDRIAAVGPAERVDAAAGPGAPVVRLHGAAVIPGLIDAHCHLCNVGYLAQGADCSQPAARSRADAAVVVGDRQRVRGVQAARGPASHPR